MAYAFTFSTIAKTTQARLRTGADVAHLAELDRKYWLVLSCSTTAMGAAGQAIATALDADHDGRVRVPEVLAAVEWLKPRLSSFDVLFTAADGLSAADLATESEAAKPLSQLFARLAPEGKLTPETIAKAFADFRAAAANGDGVVPVGVVDSKYQPIGEAMLAVTGGKPAADGSAGLAAESSEAFLKALEAYKAWRGAQPQVAIPEGVAPATAVAAVAKLAPKVSEFFTHCALVRYNPAVREALIAPVKGEQLSEAPLALPAAELTALPFEGGINPHYAAEWNCVVTLAQALQPSAEAMTADLWAQVQAAVAPFADWAGAKPAGADVFAKLDEQVMALATDPAVHEAYAAAIAEDAKQAPLAAAFDDLSRLLTLRMHFLRFLKNFVNVEDLYPPSACALFQTGTLYMDGRSCTLCFPIEKAAAAHAKEATPSNCCLAYCTLTRPSEKLTRTICAVFTAGTAEGLSVGRNGLFVDLDGKDWEATITHLVSTSISLWEAFFAPWRKIGAAFTSTIRKMVSSRGDAATSAMTAQATQAATVPDDPKAKATPPPSASASMASVATLGIALSFVATALTGIVAALTNTPIWKTALTVGSIVLVVSLPSVLLTWIKLRGRDLAYILNASGWAINRRIGLTPALSRFFTQRACYIGKKFVPGPLMMPHRNLKKFFAGLLLLALVVAGVWYFFCPTSPRNRARVCEEAAQGVEQTRTGCEANPHGVQATPPTSSTPNPVGGSATAPVEAPAPAATPAAAPAPVTPEAK